MRRGRIGSEPGAHHLADKMRERQGDKDHRAASRVGHKVDEEIGHGSTKKWNRVRRRGWAIHKHVLEHQ